MDIDNFYKKYGEKEILKQEREITMRNSDLGTSPNSNQDKKVSVPKFPKKGTKGKKKSAMRYKEEDYGDEDVGFDEIDLGGDEQPGEYDIDLSEHVDTESNGDFDSVRYSLDRSTSGLDNSTNLTPK